MFDRSTDNPLVEVGAASMVGVINITTINASGVISDDPLAEVGVGVTVTVGVIVPAIGDIISSVGMIPVPGVLLGALVASGVP
jgi:hypothetical protein